MKVLLYIILSIYCLSCSETRKKEIGNEKPKKPNVIACIDYSYQGCFGGEAYQLTVLDQNGEKIAQLAANKKIISNVKLDSSGIKLYDQFLTELKEKEFGFGCTTTAYYSVITDTDQFEKIDGGCDWNGFENLRKSLFNK